MIDDREAVGLLAKAIGWVVAAAGAAWLTVTRIYTAKLDNLERAIKQQAEEASESRESLRTELRSDLRRMDDKVDRYHESVMRVLMEKRQ